MILPQRASVTPRVIRAEAVPLEHEIRQYIDADVCGTIALIGPPGSGKTTALRHLAAVFPDVAGLVLLDTNHIADLTQVGSYRLVVYAAIAPQSGLNVTVFPMAPWNRDDLIEYLLAR